MQQECCASAEKAFKSTSNKKTYALTAQNSNAAKIPKRLAMPRKPKKHWRRLNGPELVAKVVIGVKFVDSEEQIGQAAN
jgi:hypothetical protein